MAMEGELKREPANVLPGYVTYVATPEQMLELFLKPIDYSKMTPAEIESMVRPPGLK